jgi:hypothetical protein
MAAPSCSLCNGRRWVRYFSETTEGNLEEAYRLCPCNYEPNTSGEHGCEELERVEAKGVGLANPSEGSAQNGL